jgi:ABC-type dipeptide/oligopeptide/nickel transport system permease component
VIGFARRVGEALLTAWGAVSFTFFILRVAGGDPVVSLLARGLASADQAAGLRHSLGLDRPLIDQYLRFLADLVRGDLGRSLFTGRPVSEVVAEQFPSSLGLGVVGLILATILGLTLGILSGWRPRTWAGGIADNLASLSTATPVALVGIVALWLSAPGLNGSRAGPPAAASILLPGLVLGFASCGAIARVLSASLSGHRRSPFLLAARARGVGAGVRLLWHALRPSLPVAVSLISLEAAFLFGGTVITETVFARPGLGRLLVASILQGDYPIAQGVVVVSAVLYSLTQAAGDLAAQWMDPRLVQPA